MSICSVDQQSSPNGLIPVSSGKTLNPQVPGGRTGSLHGSCSVWMRSNCEAFWIKVLSKWTINHFYYLLKWQIFADEKHNITVVLKSAAVGKKTPCKCKGLNNNVCEI